DALAAMRKEFPTRKPALRRATAAPGKAGRAAADEVATSERAILPHQLENAFDVKGLRKQVYQVNRLQPVASTYERAYIAGSGRRIAGNVGEPTSGKRRQRLRDPLAQAGARWIHHNQLRLARKRLQKLLSRRLARDHVLG